MFKFISVFCTILCTILLLTLVGCNKNSSEATLHSTTSGGESPGDKEPVVVFEGLSTPESVLYDEASDVYLVSNINGSPLADDGNGFISRLQPDGATLVRKWIDGGSEDVVLNAPKGMAIVGNRLYVSDIHAVRVFDRVTGKAISSIEIEDATFLNDITPDDAGGVYVSDSGLKAGEESFEPSGTDAIYAIDALGTLSTVVKDPTLGRPNGLVKHKNGLYAVTFGSGEIMHFLGSTRSASYTLPVGTLDGVVGLNDGSLLISSWEGSSVLRGKPGGEFSVVVADVDAPADIGYDSKRNRILVPLFKENRVEAYALD